MNGVLEELFSIPKKILYDNSMKDKWQDIRFTDFRGGLNTRVQDNLIADNESPDLKNVIFDGAGSFGPRLGSALFGATTSSTGKIRNTWVASNFNNLEVPVRVVDNNTNAWLEYYNSQTGAWENLDAGYTAGQQFGHADYNYYTYYANQKDNMRRFNSAIWSTSTYADSAYSRIDLSTSAASALGFLSAGSVIIDGEEVYYSSYSGTALSGITFTAAHNGGVGIAQLPTSADEVPAPDGGWVSASDNLPKGRILQEYDAQLFVTAASGVSGNIVYYSAVDEPTNFAISATPGGGGTARYPEAWGAITAFKDFDEILTIFKEDTIRKLEFQSLADGTAGSIEIVSRGGILTGPNVGAANHKSMTKVENDVVYVTPSGWVKSLARTDAGRKTNELSQKIRPTVEGYNMTSAAGIYYDGKYYLACATGEAAVSTANNNMVLVWDYEYNSWTKFVGWNVADWFIYNKGLYWGASNEITTYRALTTYADNTSPYDVYWSSKWLDYGVPNEQKRLNRVYIEGYMTTNTTVNVSAYFDGNTGAPTKKAIVGTGSYIDSSDTVDVIGYNTWGKGTYGGETGASTYNLKKFRAYLQYNGKNFFNMQLKIGTASPSFVWKVTHIVPYVQVIPGERVPINSII